MQYQIRTDLTPPPVNQSNKPKYFLAAMKPGECLIVPDVTKYNSLRVMIWKTSRRSTKEFRLEIVGSEVRVHCIA